MSRYLFFTSLFLLVSSCNHKEQTLIDIVDKNHPLLRQVFEHSQKYELQIRYTQINRDTEGNPSFHTISFQEDSIQYFYPASTVKMPAAFLAYEKLNELNELYGLTLDENVTIIHQASKPPQTAAFSDSTHSSLLPSLGHYIDKLFVVSDNDAYNRVYEFLGQDYLNDKLKSKNIFSNSRIVHRVGVSGFKTEDHKHTNEVEFLDAEKDAIISLKSQEAQKDHVVKLNSALKGKGYYDNTTDTVVMQPFDMSQKNFISLKDLEASLKRVIFPNSFVEEERYKLNPDQYNRIYKSMLNLPRDFNYLAQDTTYDYYDGYVKFFVFGDTEERIPDHVKILNKVGYAYGTLTDCAYIMDIQNNVEFFLSATLLVNENEIFNDGIYEYEEIGIPFLAELGRQIHFHEIEREREYEVGFDSKYEF